jgi:hypothetical protein
VETRAEPSGAMTLSDVALGSVRAKLSLPEKSRGWLNRELLDREIVLVLGNRKRQARIYLQGLTARVA